MLRRPGRILILSGIALLIVLIGGRALAEFYTDALWFAELGYGSVFWTRIAAGLGVRAVAGALAAGIVFVNLWAVTRQIGPVQLRRRYGNLEIAEQVPRAYIIGGILLASALAGLWLSELKFGGTSPISIVLWLRRAEWGVTDPIFGHDLAFYVFSLPVLVRAVDFLLLAVLWAGMLVALGYVLSGSLRLREGRLEIEDRARLHFVVLVAAMVFIVGVRYWLGRYGLLLAGSGFRDALGYTDVHARLPAHRAMAVLSVMASAAILYGGWRRSWTPPAVALGVLLVGALGIGYLYPALIQRFQVEPNQFAREAPYIGWNLEFTRRAYDVDRIERRRMSYHAVQVPPWQELEPALSRLPLWDPDPLQTTYNQIQAIYGYYHFPHVDYDRYGPPGAERQVAIAVREFNPRGMPAGSRTWQTLRLNPNFYRGLGAVVTPAAESGRFGDPVLWLGNIDPVERAAIAPPELDSLVKPSIYFGETMTDYAIIVPGRDSVLVGTAGRDYPEGIRLGPFPRLLAFAWRFGDKNLLFSGELTEDSRLLFRRTVSERIRTIAPFLLWDSDPYPVIHDGRIVWIVDGYTSSTTYPLSRPIQLQGAGTVRYLRSSVKATIDAVTGEVVIYALDRPDPLVEAYRRVFPDLFRPIAEMPPELRRHLRYPALMGRVQAAILEEYHLERPDAFYAGQDVWQVPGGLGADARPYRPQHALMRLPGEERTEFLLTIPFIARERQNMTGLLVARSDPPHYGDLILLELPRDQQIPGPRQVETLIEQDPVISQQLSLWRQSGSDVSFGHLRVVPLDGMFLYIEPLYISNPGNPIPQLTRIVASDGRSVSMAPTLAEAVAHLRRTEPMTGTPEDPGRDERLAPQADWPHQALEIMQRAEERLRAGDWAGFGAAWDELQRFLRRAALPPSTQTVP